MLRMTVFKELENKRDGVIPKYSFDKLWHPSPQRKIREHNLGKADRPDKLWIETQTPVRRSDFSFDETQAMDWLGLF